MAGQQLSLLPRFFFLFIISSLLSSPPPCRWLTFSPHGTFLIQIVSAQSYSCWWWWWWTATFFRLLENVEEQWQQQQQQRCSSIIIICWNCQGIIRARTLSNHHSFLRFLLSDLILAALPFFLAPVYDDGLLGFQLFMIQKFGLPFWIRAFGKEPRFWECLMFGHGCRVPVTYLVAEFF